MNKHVVVAFREGEPDRQFVATGDRCVIGRSPDSDLVLPDTSISRTHATIRFQGDRAVVHDEGSMNGIFLNGEQVKEALVRAGDFVSVGEYTVVLRPMKGTEISTSSVSNTLCIGYEAARRLHEESLEKQRPDQLVALYRAALLIGEQQDMPVLMKRLLDVAVDVLSAAHGVIAIRTRVHEPPCLLAQYPETEKAAEPPLHLPLMRYVMSTRSSLLTEDAQGDPRFAPVPASQGDGTARASGKSAMCVPMCGVLTVAGVWYIEAAKSITPYTQKQLEFLSALAYLAGLAFESKLKDDEMRKSERLAALGSAIAGISHDVRSHITGIRTGMELLEQYTEDAPEKMQRALRIVRNSAGQVDAYLADLVSYVQEHEVARFSTNMTVLLQETVANLEHRAAEHNVKMVLPTLPQVTAKVDAPQLQRVIQNLLSNALEACTETGGTVHVQLAAEDTALQIEVTDTGPGIDADKLDTIFEPFYTTKGYGTGLGLAVSRRIVADHGGRIEVSSTVGKGTQVCVRLPDCVITPKSASESA